MFLTKVTAKFVRPSRRVYLHLGVLVFSMLATGLLSLKLGQDINWDLLNYHFYDPFAFLHGRTFTDIQPAQLQTYNNPILDIPAYLLITHFSPKMVGFMLGAIQGINIWLVFELSLVLLKGRVKNYGQRFGLAFVIGVASIFGAASVSEIGNTMGDNLTSLGVLGALLLLLLSLRHRAEGNKKGLILRLLAYLLMGVVVGLKLPNATYAVGLLLAGLATADTYKQKAIASLQNVGMLIAGMLISSGFWYITLWNSFKNPLFPFLNGIFKSPYYPATNFSDGRWLPKTFLDYLVYPFKFAHTQNIAAEVPFRDPRVATLLTLSLLALAVLVYQRVLRKRAIKKSKEGLMYWVFGIFMAASYITWEKQFSYYRYLLSFELLSLVAIVLLVFWLIKKYRYATVASLALMALIVVYTAPINWGRIPWQHDYFGPNLRGQLSSANGVIIMAGYQPMSFLVPYLPSGDTVIRVQSDLTSPATGTSLEQRDIRSAVDANRHLGRSFYAIETSTDSEMQLDAYKSLGLAVGTCQPISTNIEEYLFYGTLSYSLCRLDVATSY